MRVKISDKCSLPRPSPGTSSTGLELHTPRNTRAQVRSEERIG
jgi:hypothetical protein